ncbi:MAG TPA: sugar fermentation stimulation protein SfsA, partial [candidate division WOR-3 bacterium]|nr:sugar fermentation stimulation protein SfsA [candidate division WOR-3 bacterium]
MKIKLMDIPWDREGIFIERPNRFLGVVDIGGEIMKIHIHD